MTSITEPSKFVTPFAESGLKNTIPATANNATGKAGFDKGFPERTMLPKASGGIPPSGMDFNGILYDITSVIRYMQAGGKPTYDAAFAAAIGGYPSGAVLIGDDGVTVFQNAVDGNATNPNSGGTGWARPDLQVMELYRRSYAEAGHNVVGTFQAGFTYVNENDVGIDLATGKGYTGPAGHVAAGTNPASGGFTDCSNALPRVSTTVAGLATGAFPVGAKVELSDRDSARFVVVSGGVADGIGVLDAGAGKTATFVVSGDTLHLSHFVNAGTTDYAAALNYAISKTGGLPVTSTRIAIPSAGIEVTDTITINKSLILIGLGKTQTPVTFNNAVANKPLFSFVRGSYGTQFENLQLFDKNPGTSEAFKFSDTVTEQGSPVLKLGFKNIFVNAFAVACRYTSANPLNGTNHAHCAEVRWTNCRFSNNVVSIINENIQAVNIVHNDCDFENFDSGPIIDTQFTFFKMLGGGELKFYGGSIIGRGTVMQWQYPVGGTTLFTGSRFLIDGTRLELRSGKTGKIFEELVGSPGSTLLLEVNCLNCMILNTNSEALDLLTYSGRVNATFRDIKVMGGSMNIRNYPTIGRSSNTNQGSYGYVYAENCGVLNYIKETSSPYGTYSENFPHEVIIKSPGVWSTNQSMSADGKGFYSHQAGGNVNSMSLGLTTRAEFGRIIYNSDQTTAGLGASLKILLPKHARPTKLIMYKHPQQFAVDTGFDLYLVKDNAAWADPANFAEATDAVLVATSVNNAGKAGYFSTDVVLASNVFGNKLQAGYASWLEGRIYLKKRGGNPFPGWVGVEYL